MGEAGRKWSLAEKKSQTPNPKPQIKKIWRRWDLELGIWDLGFGI
jgi:hypothetical protein